MGICAAKRLHVQALTILVSHHTPTTPAGHALAAQQAAAAVAAAKAGHLWSLPLMQHSSTGSRSRSPSPRTMTTTITASRLASASSADDYGDALLAEAPVHGRPSKLACQLPTSSPSRIPGPSSNSPSRISGPAGSSPSRVPGVLSSTSVAASKLVSSKARAAPSCPHSQPVKPKAASGPHRTSSVAAAARPASASQSQSVRMAGAASPHGAALRHSKGSGYSGSTQYASSGRQAPARTSHVQLGACPSPAGGQQPSASQLKHTLFSLPLARGDMLLEADVPLSPMGATPPHQLGINRGAWHGPNKQRLHAAS